MTDNRFGTMCVIRGHGDSEEWHGNETIQARLQGTGDPTPTRDAYAHTRCVAVGGCARVRGKQANGDDVVADASRGCAGVAAQASGAAGIVGLEAARAVEQACGARGSGQRLCYGDVDLGTGGQVDRARVRPLVQHLVRVAIAARSWLQCTTPCGSCHPARRAGDRRVEEEALAGAKKNARRQGRTIVFVDESGLSERPTRVRTWAPKGQTPVLQYSFNWKQLSLIAGVSLWRFYFRFFDGAIKSAQIVEYLKALKATIGGKLLIIWDGLPAHRSRIV